MPHKSKLLTALDAHKGRDYELEKRKRQQKQAVRKRLRTEEARKEGGEDEDDDEDRGGGRVNGVVAAQAESESEGWESDGSEDAEAAEVDALGIRDSESESDSSLVLQGEPNGMEGLSGDEGASRQANEGSDEADDTEEDAIPLSDLEDVPDEEKADLVPRQRLTINNTTALSKAYKSISLRVSAAQFSEFQTITSTDETAIPDVDDDLNRELAFYKQSLDAVKEARNLLKKEGMPFSRPTDYFAEMVKTDEHMGKIKQKMVDEAANKRAAADARKQRDLKKFGKQVQIAKLQERDKAKRDTLDKINLLKRKRRMTDNATAQEDELFDVALEDASKADRSAKSMRKGSDGRTPEKRRKKDEKFGFGGKKRFSKSGDAFSTSDLRGFSVKKMKGHKKGAQRLGKSRRAKKS